MSQKYLGETFDIHGGGMDLAATHHTNEIAQSQACHSAAPARFWVHTNMLTVNGQRMGKSLGNAFLPHELFEGSHPLLDKGYSPMAVRFFMLQTHYRSTLDFSNDALQASEKGFERLMNALRLLPHLQTQENGAAEVQPLRDACYTAMADDLNTPIALAQVFLGVKLINQIASGETTIDSANLLMLIEWMNQTVFHLFGLQAEQESGAPNDNLAEGLMKLILELRKAAKEQRDFATADIIRNHLNELGVQLKDTKEGTTWERNKS
jgi:cysteinyl-tRNA synthetase